MSLLSSPAIAAAAIAGFTPGGILKLKATFTSGSKTFPASSIFGRPSIAIISNAGL